MSEIKLFTCELCKYESERKDNYNRHMKSKLHKINIGELQKEEKKQEIFKCDQCEYETERKWNLEDHIKRKHINKKINCNYCNCKLVGDEEYENHIKSEEHRGNILIKLITTKAKLKKKKDYYYFDYNNDVLYQKYNNESLKNEIKRELNEFQTELNKYSNELKIIDQYIKCF